MNKNKEKKNFFSAIFKEFLSNIDMKEEDKKELNKQLSEEVDNAIKKDPIIAVIGKTGVGKSATINSLFGTNLEVSDNKACTTKPEKIIAQGKTGNIIIYDMPGVGEDIVTDETYIKYYKEILPTVDVAIWIFVAGSVGRAMAYDQIIIKRLQNELGEEITNRIIFGVNQVDLIEPGDWIDYANIPSKLQEINLQERISDIKRIMSRIINPEKIVFYSAKKRYRLVELFNAMIDACANKRGWVLNSCASIADYTELMDPEFLKRLKSK